MLKRMVQAHKWKAKAKILGVILFAGFTVYLGYQVPLEETPILDRSITVYDEDHFSDGINIVSSFEGNCLVMDMEGHVLHQYSSDTCMLLPTGEVYLPRVLLAADGSVMWRKDFHQHHWIDMDLKRETLYALYRQKREDLAEGVAADEGVFGFNKDGEIVFRWSFLEASEELKRMGLKIIPPEEIFDTRREDGLKVAHLNSVTAIPKNKSGVPEFKEGNLIISCDIHGHVFVLDRETQKVIWIKSLVSQRGGMHSAHVLESGNIMFFNNGNGKTTSVREVNPVTGEIVWEFGLDDMDIRSSFNGSASRLPNGNTLIVDIYKKGRVTEVTPDKRVVWQWLSPNFRPTGERKIIFRVQRVSKEYYKEFLKNSKQ